MFVRKCCEKQYAIPRKKRVAVLTKFASRTYGSVVQLVSTSACHAEGHGFEPRRSRS